MVVIVLAVDVVDLLSPGFNLLSYLTFDLLPPKIAGDLKNIMRSGPVKTGHDSNLIPSKDLE